MKIAAIIPARYDSGRFPGKPLAKIAGITMIQRVYRQVEKTGFFSHIIVATDHQKIAQAVKQFGGTFRITDNSHPSGTDRIWEVVESSDFDAAINIQGDEPLISEHLIRRIHNKLQTGQWPVVTAAYWNRFFGDFNSPHVVKVVVDEDFRALYFSRSPVPFCREADFNGFYQHIGIYGYSRSALEKFVKLRQSKLEKQERLEQLRFLEHGVPIAVVQSDQPSYGVDTPGDIQKIEDLLQDRTEP